MQKVYFDELENVIENTDMMGSESILCDCTLDGKHYIYKQPNFYDEIVYTKMNELSEIKNSHLLLPEIVVYQKKPIGFLLPYLDGYKSFYGLDKTKEEKILLLKKAKEAIISMHKEGIIHGDLHIANIMFKDDDIKIIDFEGSKYQNYNFGDLNDYSKAYLENNKETIGVDIHNFNIDTFSILYNVNWHYVFNVIYKRRFETTDQIKIWQKTKNKKKLTNNDFLIDRY